MKSRIQGKRVGTVVSRHPPITQNSYIYRIKIHFSHQFLLYDFLVFKNKSIIEFLSVAPSFCWDVWFLWGKKMRLTWSPFSNFPIKVFPRLRRVCSGIWLASFPCSSPVSCRPPSFCPTFSLFPWLWAPLSRTWRGCRRSGNWIFDKLMLNFLEILPYSWCRSWRLLACRRQPARARRRWSPSLPAGLYSLEKWIILKNFLLLRNYSQSFKKLFLFECSRTSHFF